MTDELTFSSYPVFRAIPGLLEGDRDVAVKEASELLADHPLVSVRGFYSTAGFSAAADLFTWWIAPTADAIQDLLVEFRRTLLGSALVPVDSFLGLVRPAEFSPDHLPAFLSDKPALRYACIYPFVRTPEWYLLPPDERGKILGEHGKAGREFPDVNANTTSAFGLGDFEWILAFEAESPDRIVELIRRLRSTTARLYTKVEIPFYTGIRKDLEGAVADLP